MQAKICGIGVDTGGTYTDAVLMDLETGQVLASGKTPTTHHDLRICFQKVLDILGGNPAFFPGRIKLVAVSSTLATNGIVEGLGADVGLFVIGLDKHFELPVGGIKQVRGGHTVLGEEEEPLDIEAVLDGALFFRGKVDTYAVISAMAFANATHEKVAARAISMVDDKPVFCSHEISGRPGMDARAATTVLNARLMPRMQTFLRDVMHILKGYGLEKDIRIIRGDGTSMDAEEAVGHAVATVASGPAATAWFGAGSAVGGDALVIDVGGTSTDMICIRKGKPLMDEGGSRIGSWDTHVSAIAMHTVGIGGDSFVRPGRNGILIGPERVLPLAMAEVFPDPAIWMNSSANACCLRAEPVSGVRDPVWDLLMEKGPKAMGVLGEELGVPEVVLRDRIAPGLRKGYLQAAGFTPTDALHVLGRLDFGNRQAACTGACFWAETPSAAGDFSKEVLREVAGRIEEALVDFLVRLEIGKDFSAIWPKKRRGDLLQMLFRLNAPIIGIGAAAPHLLADVAEHFATELLTPEYCEVGNAIGALRIAGRQ